MKNHSLKLRHFGLLVVLFLFAGSVQAQSKLETLLNKMGENDKMTVVTISKDMIGSMMNNVLVNSDSTDKKDMKKMTDVLGYMRVVSSKELTTEEQATYNKMIMEVLNEGYKDLMNISTKENGKQTNVRMCSKAADKDNISEFVMYVREGKELSLIAITGKIDKSKIMELTKLSGLKGMESEIAH
jgi:hypothetical protein